MDTKKLRQKILDLAIHGKLVPQDPNDEPASVLLERIRAEKERLIKEGKIKRGKKSASDTPHYENRQVGEANEVPFEVPESWEWTNLGDITNYGNCENVDVNDIPKEGWVLELEDLEKDSAKIIKQLTKDERDIKGVRHSFHKGDVLYSKLRTYLNKVMVANEDGFCTTEIIPITCMSYVLPEYLNHVLRSKYFVDYTIQCGYGVKMPRLSTTDACNGQIPLPPYNEQKHIVASIEGWFQLVDILESDQADLDEAIQKAKSKILDLAIHGKLVPQDPNDEPAIDLLKRINPKFTPCDNAHYENVPSNWAICKVKDAFVINPKTKADDGIDAGFVPMSNIQDSFKNSFSFETKNWGNIKKGYTHFENGDIVVAKISPCLENRKSAVMAGLPNDIGAGTTELNVFRSDSIHPLYGLFFFKSDYFISQCVGTFNGVVGQQRVSTKIIEDIAFPTPPRPEQERIINKVNELFQILDDISTEL